ncbi:hypothetical protein [Evansella tamaricis]|uniref:Radical SAM protein n=1 Tax=Evansella tamaricis TaxID=2069301 RepID=A0ABS6JM95_9BACI|nr:hypothetical protein [Evansella tamaricis]MBU9714648.1 hypothetical protein [Evansella tamaricis]
MSFTYDDRLGISVPVLETEWENLHYDTQAAILEQWESIRGNIPDRIRELEQSINQLQHQLNNEEHFEKSCELNSMISELASTINDLWIWYRTGEEVGVKKIHS